MRSGPRHKRATLLALLVSAAMALSGCASPVEHAASAGITAAKPCGRTTAPVKITNVVWIWMENHTFHSTIEKGNLPYVGRLAQACGLALNYHNVTHGSKENYWAAVTGQLLPRPTGCQHHACRLSQPTVFGQLTAVQQQWRTYAGSMPGNCYPVEIGSYFPRHNPAVYFPAIARDCRRWDQPIGSASGGTLVNAVRTASLPALTLVVPDACDDTHSCPPQTGDRWLRTWIPILLAGAQYQSGHTAVFVTWDEGRAHALAPCTGVTDPTCHVATLVVSPGTPAGTRSPTLFTHYSLLRTAEQLLGLPLLGAAGRPDTASMAVDFRLH